MGVDCSIHLPDTARFRDVAQVIGILLGQPFRQIKIGGSDGIHVEVDGVETSSGASIECAEINIPDKQRWFYYHFEFSGPSYQEHDTHCGRGLLVRSCADNIALGVALVKFFGGFVDFNDSDEHDYDFAWPEQSDIRANNGEAWNSYHRRMLALKPLTKKDIEQYESKAAYH